MIKPEKDNHPVIKEYPVGTLFGEEEIDAIRRVLQSGEPLTRGQDVELFEKEFAEYCGAKYAVAVSSCGAALTISSKILELKPDDEVICQGNAFWVTHNHLHKKNVRIICADVDPETLNIDPDKIEPLITKKTKAIYLMHHGGNPADLDPIRNIAMNHGLEIVEDCAHALGAEYKGKKIGQDSSISCFSFSTLKNISTLGEGGMFVTNNKEFAELARRYRTNYPHGISKKRKTSPLGGYSKPQILAFMNAGDSLDYDWTELLEMGSTYRMSTPQAAVGRVQLKKLDSLIEKRKNIALHYNDIINEIDGLRTIKVLPDCKHAWHLYSYFLDSEAGIDRNGLVKYMSDKHRIQIMIRFWPIHLDKIMRMNGCGVGGCDRCVGLDNLERVWFREQLSLPISPQISDDDIDHIAKALMQSMNELGTL